MGSRGSRLALFIFSLNLQTSLLAASERPPEDLFKARTITEENCQNLLDTLSDRLESFELEKLEPAYLDQRDNSASTSPARWVPRLQKLSWEARLDARRQMQEIYRSGQLNEICVDSFRRYFSAARYFEEYIGDFYYTPILQSMGVPAADPKTFDSIQRLANADYFAKKGKTLGQITRRDLMPSGALFTTRGADGTAVSASIARMGDVDGHFSHLAQTYTLEDGTPKIIEAHIEYGMRTHDVGEFLSRTRSRVAVYMYQDETLAHEASGEAYKIVHEAEEAGHPLPYDFDMRLYDHSSFFCTEMGHFGFELAGKNHGQNIDLPTFKSKISRNRQLLDRVGMTDTESFMPSDLEVDPKFELVGEWRNPARVRMSQLKDATLSKIYEWMREKNYVLHYDNIDTSVAGLALTLRNSGDMGEKWLGGFLPTYIPQATVETIVGLNFIVDKYSKRLLNEDRAYRRRTAIALRRQFGIEVAPTYVSDREAYGFGLSWKRLMDELERIRLQDIEKDGRLHTNFRPD